MKVPSRPLWLVATGLSMLLTGGLVLVAAANEGAREQPPPPSRSTDPEADLGLGPEEAEDADEDEHSPIHLVGEVSGAKIVARAKPSEKARKIASFGKLNEQGAPQVFLLAPEETDERGFLPEDAAWVKALLPLRPNGTTGYLKVEELVVRNTPFRLVINRAAFQLKLFEGDSLVMKVPVGIGTGGTPTPIGDFYLASLLEPPDPNSVYGTYAYGLSGYSETLLDWKGGGVIGLHGTNDPSSIGGAVSHGCIRMRNKDIEKLVPLLPLGTPIEIK